MSIGNLPESLSQAMLVGTMLVGSSSRTRARAYAAESEAPRCRQRCEEFRDVVFEDVGFENDS